MKPVKSELDYDTLEEVDYVASAKKVKAETSPESSDSEEETSQGPEQEATDDKLTGQLNELKASVKSEDEPPATAVNTAGPPADVKETGNPPVRSYGNIDRPQEKLAAVLKLGPPCQQMIICEDQLQSGRLPGDTVIIHGGRNAIELKILMHRQGYKIRLFQDDKEIEDDFRLKTLSTRILLQVLEEPLPRSYPTSQLKYAVNQSLVGTALANDPHIPGVLPQNAPRFASFIHPEAQHSVVILNLEGDPLVFPEPRGAGLDQIRRALWLGPEVAITG